MTRNLYPISIVEKNDVGVMRCIFITTTIPRYLSMVVVLIAVATMSIGVVVTLHICTTPHPHPIIRGEQSTISVHRRLLDKVGFSKRFEHPILQFALLEAFF